MTASVTKRNSSQLSAVYILIEAKLKCQPHTEGAVFNILKTTLQDSFDRVGVINTKASAVTSPFFSHLKGFCWFC